MEGKVLFLFFKTFSFRSEFYWSFLLSAKKSCCKKIRRVSQQINVAYFTRDNAYLEGTLKWRWSTDLSQNS